MVAAGTVISESDRSACRTHMNRPSDRPATVGLSAFNGATMFDEGVLPGLANDALRHAL